LNFASSAWMRMRPAVLGAFEDQRVDLDERGVGLHVAGVELLEDVDRLRLGLLRDADAGGELARGASPRPSIGSMKMRMIFSGVSWATFSMSMPPSLEPIIATFWVARSVSTAT
jgi:hypothetical protein